MLKEKFHLLKIKEIVVHAMPLQLLTILSLTLSNTKGSIWICRNNR
jgi:hypothetical protein